MDFHSNGGIKTKCRRDGGALQNTTAPLLLLLLLLLPTPTPTRTILRGNAILKLEKIIGLCSGLADPASHQDEAIL
jgi:hypothetical protein